MTLTKGERRLLKKVQFYEQEWIAIKDVKRDPTNPNVMTPEEEAQLDGSIQDFGFAVPLVLDQNSLIANGEHRLDRLILKFGLKPSDKVPFYRVHLKNDAERRLLRQALNKIHGQHDLLKDVEEIRIINEAGFFDRLSRLIGEKEAKVLLEGGGDVLLGGEETPADRFQLTLYLPIERKDEVEGFISDMKKNEKKETAGDVFLLLMERYNESNS